MKNLLKNKKVMRKVAAVAISMLSLGGVFLSGIGIKKAYEFSYEKYNDAEEIINNHKDSDSFKTSKQLAEELLGNQLESGKITQGEYMSAMDYFKSKEYVASRLPKEERAEYEENKQKQSLASAGVIGCMAGVMVSAGSGLTILQEYIDEKKREHVL